MKSTFAFSSAAALVGFAAGALLFRSGSTTPVASGGGPGAAPNTRAVAAAKNDAPAAPRADDHDPARASHAASAPRQILGRIAALKVDPSRPRTVRQLMLELERLREAGPAALPAIREFLARGDDADYDAALVRGPKAGRLQTEFVVPPSLRLGLLEVAREIGGPLGEQVLLETLKTTGRGVEAAYAAAALQEMAPDKYRDAALAAARDLLGMPLASKATNVLDRSDRDYLYGVLTAFGDQTYVDRAKADMIQAGGRVDPAALRYLQQALGERAIAAAAEAWRDPRLTPEGKEPLARLALNYVGASHDALQLWQLAIDDPQMPKDARRNLIEDLNQDGFTNPKKPTPADLALIQQRIALIERLLPRTTDPVNVAAFKEAQKDLVAMQARLTAVRTKP